VNNGAGCELTQMTAMPDWGRRPHSLNKLTAGRHHGRDSNLEDACHDSRHQPSRAMRDGLSCKG
jgi:hypothetical protein